MFEFIYRFTEAWKIVSHRSNTIDQHGLFSKDSQDGEALTAYRKLWPKTPYTPEDDAHEAGFVLGYNLSREKYLGPHLKA